MRLIYSMPVTKKIIITPEVSAEFGQALPDWIVARPAWDIALKKTLQKIIGEGEASAIALAFELKDCLFIIDNHKARKIAKSLNFKVTGVLGVIVKPKN